MIIRGGRRIRVGLAGPGQAFGYETLIDGGPSPVTATTRERALLLVLPQEPFERLFNSGRAPRTPSSTSSTAISSPRFDRRTGPTLA